MKTKYSYKHSNSVEFIFGKDRKEAESILKGLYGASANTENLKETDYQIFN